MPTAETIRARVLGCPVDVIDLGTAVARLVQLVERKRAGEQAACRLVVTINPEMIVAAGRDPEFHSLLDGAALVVPDGIGVVLALRRRGYAAATRVAGADLFDAYVAAAAQRGHRIALVGAAPGIAELAADRYRQRYPGVQIVLADGGDPGPDTARRLRAAAPDMVAAAYGHGRQEKFLNSYLAEIGAAFGIGIGGSLDYVVGTVPRAPVLIRRANLEWAWRLARQPSRWRRQLILPAFWWRQRRETSAESREHIGPGRGC